MGHSVAMRPLPASISRRFIGHAALAVVVLGVAACGGGAPDRSPTGAALDTVDLTSAPRFAQGHVSTACKIHNRETATARQCSCIQAAADLTLSQSEQQRAVRFFAEPELLQQIKLSDTPQNERFWYTWARFAETAEQLCNGV